jgi:hypothetical protein
MRYKNKILYNFLCALLSTYNEKGERTSESLFVSVSEFYINFFKRYRTRLFMNINMLKAKNKNINLYSKLYVLYVHNRIMKTKI